MSQIGALCIGTVRNGFAGDDLTAPGQVVGQGLDLECGALGWQAHSAFKGLEIFRLRACAGAGGLLCTLNMDKLEEIFDLQDALNKRIGVDLDALSDEEKAKWVLQYSRAMQQELAELIDSVPWKWWAKYQEFDEQNAKVEVVDLFHFLVSAAQVLGMTADDVYEAYTKKNKVNHNRQDSGYDKKDESDSRHI